MDILLLKNKPVSTLRWTNYVTVTLYLNDLKHVFVISVLQFLITLLPAFTMLRYIQQDTIRPKVCGQPCPHTKARVNRNTDYKPELMSQHWCKSLQPDSKFWWKAWIQWRLLINRLMTIVLEWHVWVSTYFWPCSLCTEQDKLVCALWWTNYVMATVSKLPQTNLWKFLVLYQPTHTQIPTSLIRNRPAGQALIYACIW